MFETLSLRLEVLLLCFAGGPILRRLQKTSFYMLLLLAISLLRGQNCVAQTKPTSTSAALWYRTPAFIWDQALPVGNGRLGAMVFGGANSGDNSFRASMDRPRDFSVKAQSRWMPETVEVALLPALPEEWKSGSVEGLHVRGGSALSMHWEDGRIVSLRIDATQDGSMKLTLLQHTGILSVRSLSRGGQNVRADGSFELKANTPYEVSL